jgi:hypothetical protein
MSGPRPIDRPMAGFYSVFDWMARSQIAKKLAARGRSRPKFLIARDATDWRGGEGAERVVRPAFRDDRTSYIPGW